MKPKITHPKVRTLRLIKIKCPECKRYFESKRAVNNHLTKEHGSTYKIDINSQCLSYLRTTLTLM